MSELLLKFNQLNALQKQEVLDFLDFLLAKSKKQKPDGNEYKKRLLEISVWSDDDLAVFDENRKHFDEWQPTEW